MKKKPSKIIGRPPLKPGEAKDVYVRVRVTKAQRKEINRRAKSEKYRPEGVLPLKNTSAWILMMLGIE